MEEKDDSKRPEDSNFKQQRLRAWQPLLTPPWVIGTFFTVAAVFLIIGGVCLAASQSVVEIEHRYDVDDCQTVTTGNLCQFAVPITKEMKPPVFFYYKLTNYYQNHRRYVKSRDDLQLSGGGDGAVSLCDPLETGAGGLILYPCGLIANSFFNDTFSACVVPAGSISGNCTSLSGLDWNKNGIAWPSDVDKKFKYRTPVVGEETTTSPNGFVLPRVDDEDFIVWMRTAGLPTFKKLYRKIETTTLNVGDYLHVTVNSTYPVDGFSGGKYFVISTTSWLGGKNDFLGLAYIIVGAICFALALAFLAKHCIAPRVLGDTTYLSWAPPSSSGKQRNMRATEAK